MRQAVIVMAEMIPDNLPRNATLGEKRVFRLLQKLPEDCLVYYEPKVNRRIPDFVVIIPDLGVLIIEVKGWYLGNLLEVDDKTVRRSQRDREIVDKHPLEQARSYMWRLVEECQQSLDIGQLLHKEGPHRNRFVFPFGHMAVLTQIARQKAGERFPEFDRIFPPAATILADTLEIWESHDPGKLRSALAESFDPRWPFPPLNATQVDILRMIIHPEIRITPPAHRLRQDDGQRGKISSRDIKVLDRDQERYARSIGEGHRIIYGVAGSGKTVILISRARYLAGQFPDKKILLLCYNVSLAAYLRHLLAEHPHITVTHFDGWAKAQGLVRYPNEPDDKLGQRFLNSLCKHKGKHETFDAVLIDEAQDFCPNWFSCARAMLKDPDEGDFLIVGDGAQGLYRHRNFHWSDVGIKAAGRTISARFRLDRNYRNSAEIVRLAAQFAQAGEFNEDEGIAALKVDPVNCVRSTGHMPILHDPFPTRQAEAAQIAQIVDGLLKGIWDNQPIGAPLLPENIALLYRKCSDSFKPADGSGKTDREHMENLIETLRPVCPVRWISDKTHYSLREEVCEDGLKIQTIHSSKGLQYRAVIVIWADQMPFTKYGVTEDDENRLFYVALTRAEDFLAITYTGKSPLTEKLETMK